MQSGLTLVDLHLDLIVMHDKACPPSTRCPEFSGTHMLDSVNFNALPNSCINLLDQSLSSKCCLAIIISIY